MDRIAGVGPNGHDNVPDRTTHALTLRVWHERTATDGFRARCWMSSGDATDPRVEYASDPAEVESIVSAWLAQLSSTPGQLNVPEE